MYAYIKGKLIYGSPLFALLETGGIGYKIFIPASLYVKLPPLGQELQLYTSFVVRELSQALYGFLKDEERELFETLLGVTGIGPKSALGLLGHMPIYDLQMAISHGDTFTLTKIPGVGKKTAERLIIEMRDKINLSTFASVETTGPKDPGVQKVNDAMGALINLGYNQMTAQKAVKKCMKELPESINLADFISFALKNI
jgi:Holliday junction DNA helicase RuvA